MDVKWIKICVDIFDDEAIELIEQMPEGDAIIVIWLKLLTKAGKINNSGLIYFKENIPYTDEMLSTILKRNIGTIRLALQVFQKFGMIEILETNEILISNWDKHQNLERLEKIREQTKDRVRKYRDNQKLLTCNVTVTHGNATDIDKDKDKDNNIVPKKNKSSKSGNESNNNNATIKTKEELQAWDFKNDENFKEWFLKFPEETREALLKKYSKRGTCEKPSDYIAMKIEEIINYHPKKPYKDYKKVLQNWINMDIDRL
jgi:predicted phage replisome organizer